MDMVERVTKAIYAALEKHQFGSHVGTLGDGMSAGYTCLDGDFDLTAAARAAIAAMREPTEEMVRAGVRALNVANYGMPEYGPEDEAEMAFSAMIDAALTSSEKGE